MDELTEVNFELSGKEEAFLLASSLQRAEVDDERMSRARAYLAEHATDTRLLRWRLREIAKADNPAVEMAKNGPEILRIIARAFFALLVCTSAFSCSGSEEVSPRSQDEALLIPEAPADSAVAYQVQRGDTLWRIAQNRLGSGARWREIAAANGISDPSRLRVGASLSLPSR